MGIISLDIQNIFRESLFWLHVFFIIAAVSVGLLVTPLVALVLVVFHRAHIFFFGECLLSKAQRKAGGLPEDMNFLQLAAKRFFQKDISLPASRVLDYSLAGLALAVAFAK